MRRVAILGLALCLFVVVLYGLTRGDWLQGILAGITLAMAMLPEEFPVVLTIFLALGAWRFVQDQRPGPTCAVIETLGSATVSLRRQDRHADRKSNVHPQAGRERLSGGCRTGRQKRRCLRHSTRSSNTAFWRASVIRSTRWRKRFTISARPGSQKPNTCTPSGRWNGLSFVPRRAGDVARLEVTDRSGLRFWRPKARRKRSRISAI